MRFVLLVGCLSLSALAAVVTVRLRNLNRKFAGFPPIYGNEPHRARPIQNEGRSPTW